MKLWESDMWASKKNHEFNVTVSVFFRHRDRSANKMEHINQVNILINGTAFPDVP